MNKINKKTIIYILIFICVISIYYLTTKEEYIENIDVITEEYKENTLLEKEDTEDVTNEKIIVHISGAVQNQGVYEIEIGGRISDIIECAGGLTKEANIENINLAYILEDGMKVYIPLISENINSIKDNTENYVTRENGQTQNIENNKTTININTATQTELETLPGIGPSIALKIINYRKENGKFNKIEDLKKVNGIGENKFNKIKDLINI